MSHTGIRAGVSDPQKHTRMDKLMHICNHSTPAVRRNAEVRGFSDAHEPARWEDTTVIKKYPASG